MIGYLGAFLGGLFTLVSPCGALLLPAFFAYGVTGRAALLARTGVFYAGLAAAMVPLGMGAAQAGRLVFGHQRALSVVAGLLLIGFGVLQFAGGGFSPVARLRGRVRGDSWPAILALGAVSGLTGFCTGPILGAVLTVAATSGQALRGGLLLAVYAAGMTAPLFVLAALWERYDLGHRRWLRGRGVRLGPLRLHTTTLISGTVFAALGVLFLASGGTTLSVVPAPPSSWTDALNDLATGVRVPDLVLIAVLALVVAALTLWRLRAAAPKHRPDPAETPDPADP
ncbi:cytochrome c biogenesis CcdA family protein [Spirillospora sp. NBC_01491]|uniref:cytochrome c biogenesis CcdA family protein n=1 Tax=Spirillospora sp. NBC_01491 TaxID=2976007 RepID=UPI002E33AB1F|nr:cytochrome c biogenesis CcdA family protein [Spirillospora sp. NBC_01491]